MAVARTWIAWLVLAVAAAAIGLSFVWKSDDGADASARRGGSKPTPVAVVEVTRGTMIERARYPGELDADTADAAAFYGGRIIAVRVRVGDTVAAGDVVAELDPIDAREQIAQARAQARAAAAERNRAKVERDAAAAEVARLEPLAQQQLISALEIDRQRAKANALAAAVETASAGESEAHARVKLLEKRIVESVVKAPFAGRIAERFVDPGAVVAAGARLVRVVATSPLRIRFEVPGSDVGRVREGTKLAVVTQASASAGAVTATVSGIASEVSRERRVAAVEAEIQAPPPSWLPGMYAEAIVDLRTLEGATIVPAVAVLSRLQADGKVAVGVLVAGKGVARWVPVREVAREADRVAVEGALQPGDEVLVAGHVDLGDGNKIVVTGGDKP